MWYFALASALDFPIEAESATEDMGSSMANEEFIVVAIAANGTKKTMQAPRKGENWVSQIEKIVEST